MAGQRGLSQDAVLAVLRRETADRHFGYAPGRISFEGLYAALAIGGLSRGASSAAALRQTLEGLVETGQARSVEVVGPDGRTSRDWYEPGE